MLRSDHLSTGSRLRLPGQCAVCRTFAAGVVCAQCLSRFTVPGPRCQRCALRVASGVSCCGACLREAPPQTATLAAIDYAYPWDELLRRFKFHAALDLAAPFARQLLQALQGAGAGSVELILPAPLAGPRLQERGYNQAWELARRLASWRGTAADAGLLLRVRDTPHQLALPLAERAANVRGTYAIEPRRRHELRGRRVAIVDDVMTTGATAHEMTRAVLQAGAAEVHLWVYARTPAADGA